MTHLTVLTNFPDKDVCARDEAGTKDHAAKARNLKIREWVSYTIPSEDNRDSGLLQTSVKLEMEANSDYIESSCNPLYSVF